MELKRSAALVQVTSEDGSHACVKPVRCVVSEASPISHSEVAQWLNLGLALYFL